MRYGFGATDTGTAAAEALTIGQGLCQDYAHIMIALCREAGMAARYVSGHMLGEGGSHAWVEVLIQEVNALEPTPLTPPTAAARISATSPSPSGATTATLRRLQVRFLRPIVGGSRRRSGRGLTWVEYEDGEKWCGDKIALYGKISSVDSVFYGVFISGIQTTCGCWCQEE